MNAEREKRITVWYFGSLAVLGLIINVLVTLFAGYSRSDAQGVAAMPTEIISPRPTTPAIVVDPYAGFSTEAQRALADDFTHENKGHFAPSLSVQCISASEMPKKFSGYGISADVVVVRAQFHISATTANAEGSNWSKTYDVSETIDSAQFQGLTSSDTIQRVVRSLKEQMQADSDFLVVMKTSSKQ